MRQLLLDQSHPITRAGPPVVHDKVNLNHRRVILLPPSAGICIAHTAGRDGDAGEDSDGRAAPGSRGKDEAVYGELLARAYQM